MAIEKKVTRRKRRKSTKGRLIKGMTRKLPSSLFESPYFKVALVKVMKHFSGIYALYKGGELYYVGLTRDLYGRMNGHLKDRHRHRWDTFKIFRIKNINYLKDIETLILQIHPTNGNRQLGKVPSKYIHGRSKAVPRIPPRIGSLAGASLSHGRLRKTLRKQFRQNRLGIRV